MNKIRVCYPFAGDVVGGSHISALGLLKRLDRARFEPLIFVQRPDGAIAKLFREADVPIEAAPATPYLAHAEHVRGAQLLGVLRGTARLRAALRARDIDVVHTNDGRTHATWGLAAKLAGCRLVWHHRGAPDAIGLRYVAPLLADAVISVSRFAAGDRIAANPRHQVLHSPFDTRMRPDRSAAGARLAAELGCDPARPIVGFFGALTARKRPLLFVDAIASLRALDPELGVIGAIFGEEFDVTAADLAARAEVRGCADAIRFMNFREGGADWLSACDLLIVPAVDEPFGRTLVEAMLVGTPVVATRSGGNAEALRDGRLGVLVPPEDADALARAAAGLLRDGERWRHYARLAQEDAGRRFGERRHADSVMAIYDGLRRDRPSAGRSLPCAS